MIVGISLFAHHEAQAWPGAARVPRALFFSFRACGR